MKSLLVILLIALCSFTIYISKNSYKKQQNIANKGQTANVGATVDNLHPGIKIPDDFLGLSYEITSMTDTVYFKSTHTKFKNLINGLGKGVLRLNGYYINFVPWSNHKRTAIMTKGNNNYLTDSIATTDLDTLFSFVRTTKWKIILGINFAKLDPNLTFSEVNYAWSKGKDVILAFELGNEPEGLFKIKFADYYKSIIPHYDKIRSNLPQVPLCGPASLYPNFFVKDWVKNASDRVNFITVHLYNVGEDKAPKSIDQLLNNKYILKADAFSKQVDSIVSEKKIRYRIDECNNYGDGGVGVSERFASALWGIDFMFTVAKNNCAGINFHGGGWGFTPIVVTRGKPVTPNPLYYGMLFFHLAGQGRLIPINLTGGNPDLKGYAVLGADKKVYVTLINKDPQNDVSIKLSAKTKFAKGDIIRLSAPAINSLQNEVTLGGAQVDKLGNWKQKTAEKITSSNGSFSLKVQAGSAALVTISN